MFFRNPFNVLQTRNNGRAQAKADVPRLGRDGAVRKLKRLKKEKKNKEFVAGYESVLRGK